MNPILVSMKTAIVATLITFVVATYIAYKVVHMKKGVLKSIIDTLMTLPLVLPPTVAGFFLLMIFGVHRPVGKFLIDVFDLKIVFTWTATVIAAVIISLPLMYNAAKSSFMQVNKDYVYAGQTLGLSNFKIFWKIIFPIALPSLMNGCILAFTRSLGEFGATTMLAGNIPGVTRTLPLAIYSATSANAMDEAYGYVLILVAISFLAIALMNIIQVRKDTKSYAN